MMAQTHQGRYEGRSAPLDSYGCKRIFSFIVERNSLVQDVGKDLSQALMARE
jgi:hypothetical protein